MDRDLRVVAWLVVALGAFVLIGVLRSDMDTWFKVLSLVVMITLTLRLVARIRRPK